MEEQIKETIGRVLMTYDPHIKKMYKGEDPLSLEEATDEIIDIIYANLEEIIEWGWE